MKKYLLSLALMMMGASLFTSCLSNDNNNDNTPQKVTVTSGAFIINNGQWNKNNGSLTFFDYKSTSATTTLMGGSGLGDTPNDACLLGDTIFVVGSTDNMIFLVNRKSLSMIDYVSTTELMGESEGYSPRAITAFNNKLYFTTYGGYVGELNPKTLQVERKFKVGSAPEGLAFGGTSSEVYLFVCNSDYGNGDGSISRINMTTGSIDEIKNDKVKNPQKIFAIGTDLYVLDWGHYDEMWNQIGAGLYYMYNGTATQVVKDATDADNVVIYVNGQAVGYEIITFNYPYGSTTATYSKFNTYTGQTTSLVLSGDSNYKIESPSAIGVDPLSGNIIIASRTINKETGYADYTMPGFANMYTNSGQYIEGTHFQTGVEPHKIGFTLDQTVVSY
jgi:hypothetical protein